MWRRCEWMAIRPVPHIIIETDAATAAKLDTKQLVGDLHITLAAQDTVNKSSIKTRLHIAEVSMAGEDEVPGFIAVLVKLLPGRTETLKAHMAEALLGVVKNVVSPDVSASVEIVELGVYRK